MRKKLITVLKEMSQTELGKIMGCGQPRIWKLLHGHKGETNVYVNYKYKWIGKKLVPYIDNISYDPANRVIERKK